MEVEIEEELCLFFLAGDKAVDRLNFGELLDNVYLCLFEDIGDGEVDIRENGLIADFLFICLLDLPGESEEEDSCEIWMDDVDDDFFAFF